MLQNSPKYLEAVSANKEKALFQNRPIMLPSKTMQTFLGNVPSSGKVNEIKRKLNIISASLVSCSINGKNKSTQETMAPNANPNTI